MNVPQYEILGNTPGNVKIQASCSFLVFLSTNIQRIYRHATLVSILTVNTEFKSTRISATN